MSTAQIDQASPTTAIAKPPTQPWIINSWVDPLFIVGTPVLIIPIVFFLHSGFVGIEAETISLVVTSFFALGHHFPGMLRAYGDRELFQRFHLRFILTPPLLFAVYFPLYHFHFELFRLFTMTWATWHGLMQLYGFVRIYDMKVGSKSRVTAYCDWLLCLCGFITPQLVSETRMSGILDYWYAIGGPLISPLAVHGFQWACLAISVAVLIAFCANYVYQSLYGTRPNPIKLLMLISGIGFWWFAVLSVENVVLGIALFDIAHDIQYTAIVWLYNCRRVNTNPNVGKFMSFVFRRGMVLLYVGLIAAYGAVGLVPSLVHDETIKSVIMGLMWTSTILHYYMDGFIWKVRESSTQSSLGLSQTSAAKPAVRNVSGFNHFLKWSPAFLLLGWLGFTDLTDSSLSAAKVKELKRVYTQQLSNRMGLPKDEDEQSWLYTEFEHVKNIAAASPLDRGAQMRAAVMLANFGRINESLALFEKQLAHSPDYAEGHLMIGQVYLKSGNVDKANSSFESALACARTTEDRTMAKMKIGEIHWMRNEFDLAKASFQEAVKENPKLERMVNALRDSKGANEETP